MLILYVVPAVFLAAGTLLFWLTDLDLRITARFYDSGGNRWPYAGDEPWATLYKLGVVPAIATAVLAFSGLMLSVGRPKLAPYRKVFAYLLLALVLGPGLFANTIFKDNWGRPRPREVETFGGEDRFEPLLTIDPASDGKSFVCGHATMGFYFYALGLVLIAAGRKKTGALVILGATVFGALIGAARVVQGGHFASDVLWAAGVVWFLSAGLFQAFRLHRNVLYRPVRPVGAHIPRWVPAGTLAGLLLIIGTTSLAFPYSREKDTTLVAEDAEYLPDTIVLELDLEGIVEIARGDELALQTESRGFGFPRSELSNNRIFTEEGAEVTHQRNGFFTEMHARTRVTLPANRVYKINLGKRVESVYVIPPEGEFDPGNFAHVRLTTGPPTKVMNLEARIVDEDFYGRKTRAFSF